MVRHGRDHHPVLDHRDLNRLCVVRLSEENTVRDSGCRLLLVRHHQSFRQYLLDVEMADVLLSMDPSVVVRELPEPTAVQLRLVSVLSYWVPYTIKKLIRLHGLRRRAP